MVDVNKHNELMRKLLTQVGREIAELDSYAPEMVVIESLTAGLIASACIRHNKQPEFSVETFYTGLREALDRAIYGRKQ